MSELHSNSNLTSASANNRAVCLKDVHLTLESAAGEVNILRGISLAVEQGEAVGIIGPSGGGKSTMMMVIAGLERASSGQVETAGIDLGQMDEDALALFRRDNVGIVFQDFHLIPTMTALENVAVPLEFAGIEDADERARDRLAAVGLDHRLEHYPGQLSGGEQQRVALARALMNDPDIILADEPTGNLDVTAGGEITAILQGLHADEGKTIVMVTHDLDLAQLADQVYVMREGGATPHDPACPLTLDG